MELNLVLSDSREEWEGVEVRKVQEGGIENVLTVDSRCCMAETNTKL